MSIVRRSTPRRAHQAEDQRRPRWMLMEVLAETSRGWSCPPPSPKSARPAARAGRHRARRHFPLERVETALHPWVSFVIMPLFALANAGVPIELGELRNPVAWPSPPACSSAKPLGIVLFSGAAILLGLARLPAAWTGNPDRRGCLAGIGSPCPSSSPASPSPPTSSTPARSAPCSARPVSAIIGSMLLAWYCRGAEKEDK